MGDEAKANFDVIVLGGGLCGLTTAWKLAEAGHRVALLEKEDHPGGLVNTETSDGWLFEHGPNSFLFGENDDIHQVLRELDLIDKLVTRAARESHRYIWRSGALRKVPGSPMQILKKNAISRRTIARASTGIWRKHGLGNDDISVGAFFSHTLGRQAVEQVLSPVLAGIYGADPFSLSLEAVMPGLHKAAKSSPNLAKAFRTMKQAGKATNSSGPRIVASFKNGMATLPYQLANKAADAGAHLLTNFKIENLQRHENGHWLATDSHGNVVSGAHVVCALPATAASRVLQNAAPESASVLANIRYVPMVSVCMGVRENEVGVNHAGFGYLAVRNSDTRSLGMIWSERVFDGRAPDNHRLFTVFLGGQIDSSVFDQADHELLDIVKRDLRTVMQWTGDKPVCMRIRRISAAIPLLEVGHLARVRAARESLPESLHLTGNYVAGVSVPSCIRAGLNMARKVFPDDKPDA